ncbi:MAG: hypothetical protein M5R36_08070 [Deltaproteobacteria bacterium]|nr:hypothetical protein [Deltaproteobacteria bacterium]
MTDDDKSRETVGGYEIDPESVKLLPQLFCFSSSVVVLGRVDPASREPVTVGMAEPSNLATLDTVERRFAPRRVSAVRLEKDGDRARAQYRLRHFRPVHGRRSESSGNRDASG